MMLRVIAGAIFFLGLATMAFSFVYVMASVIIKILQPFIENQAQFYSNLM